MGYGSGINEQGEAGAPRPGGLDAETLQELCAVAQGGDEAAFEAALGRLPGLEISASLIEQLKRDVDQLIRRDAREALRMAHLAFLLAQRTAAAAVRALGWRTRGNALHVLSRYAEAVEHYEQARRLYGEAGQAVDRARVGRAMIDALCYLGEYERALGLAEEARAVFEAHGEWMLLAQLESNTGNIYHRLDRNHDALARYERAAELFETVAPEQLAQVTFNRANIYCNLGDFQQAQALYEKAYELHCAADDLLGAVQTRYSLGYLHFLRGAHHPATRILHQTRAESLELGDELTAALCLQDLAEIHLQTHALEEAGRRAAEARDLFLSLGLRAESARCQSFLGLVHLRRSRFEEAARAFAEARKEYEQEGNHVQLGVMDLYFAELALGLGRGEEGLRLAGAAERLFEDRQLTSNACWARLLRARAQAMAGAPDLELRERLLQDCRDVDSPWIVISIYELLGDAALAGGDRADARAQYLSAVDLIEEIRSQIRVDDFRSAFFRGKLPVYEKLIRLCLEEEESARQAEAFYFLERSKARTLLDLLMSEWETIPPEEDGRMAALHRQWRELREQLHWRYNRMNRSDADAQTRTLAAGERLQAEILQFETSLAATMRELQALDPRFAAFRRGDGIRDEDVRRFLAEDEAVIEYFLEQDALHIFVIDAGRTQVVSTAVRMDEIRECAQQLRFQLDKFQYGASYLEMHGERLVREINESLHELWKSLFAPISQLVREKRLTFIPYGVLHNIPFQALYDGERYLVDRVEVAQAPSASLLRNCGESSARTRRSALILGLADTQAPQITEEIEAIRSLFPDSPCFLGQEATAEALQTWAAESDIVHLASHARFRQDNPQFSALRLADMWLNFYDASLLRLPASLVVLSGCCTGTSRIGVGDELMGLASGFLSAGAASLLASLWMVNDSATAKMMKALYRRLQHGDSIRSALRAAILETKSEYRHPYYWAPFILIGRN